MNKPIPFHELHRALVIKLRHHGDVLLTSPVLSALKAQAPQCEIDALVYADTLSMLEGHPALDRIHTIDRRWKQLGIIAQGTAEWHLLSALRARQYDLVIHLTEHRRGAWLTRLLAPRFSVAPRLPGRGSFWRDSFSHHYHLDKTGRRHVVEYNLDALRALGIDPPPELRKLSMVPGREAEARIVELMQSHGLALKSFIHVHPTSRWLFKCWPAEKTAALLDALHAQGHQLVLTAAPDAKEMALIASIMAATNAPCVNLSGKLSLKELAAFTAQARLFIGVDSAPMHIAAAMGTPTVALFGPSGDKEWGPWQVSHRVVTTDHSCRPCGQAGCGGSKISDCLVTLPLERVLKAVTELLP
ncbi:MAG: putative lipopolysaccharide heptosyltransferase III [Georgfuchsia sp.]